MGSHSHTLARLNQPQRQPRLAATSSQAPRTNKGLEVGPGSALGAWSPNHSKPQGSQLVVTDQGQIMPPSGAAAKALPSNYPGILSQSGFSVFSEDSKEHQPGTWSQFRHSRTQ